MKLKDFNLESETEQILEEFEGFKDSKALFNIKDRGRILQFQLVLIDENEPDFIDWEGVPTIKL